MLDLVSRLAALPKDKPFDASLPKELMKPIIASLWGHNPYAVPSQNVFFQMIRIVLKVLANSPVNAIIKACSSRV